MKEKLLAALKLALGQTTATSDRTLEQWIAYLTPRITEESQIAGEIELIKPLLTTYDGNINHVVATEVNKLKSTLTPPTPQTPPADPPPSDEPKWFKEWKETEAKKTEEIKQQLEGFKKEKSVEQLIADAKSAIQKKYRITESEKALSEKALAIELRINQHADVDSLVKGWKSQYEELRSASGLGTIEILDGNSGKTKKDTPVLSELKKTLQREGKLPTPQTN